MKAKISDQIRSYIDYRRSLGYTLDFDERMLRSFERFAKKHGYHGSLRREWIDQFVYEPKDVQPPYYAIRLRVLHDFAKYWATYDSSVEVPYRRITHTSYRRAEPRVYTAEEVQMLMAAARSNHVDEGIPGETHATIIGLMACSGLRTGEAASLRKQDVDWSRSLLRIRQSKGRPVRLVPLHQTAIAALRKFAELRDECFPRSKQEHFFLTKSGAGMKAQTISATFYRIRFRSGIAIPGGTRAPRPYDLRHTFACNCLIRWLRQGREISRSMQTLATYLGHESMDETYWYLSGVPAILELVGEKFADYAVRVFERGPQS